MKLLQFDLTLQVLRCPTWWLNLSWRHRAVNNQIKVGTTVSHKVGGNASNNFNYCGEMTESRWQDDDEDAQEPSAHATGESSRVRTTVRCRSALSLRCKTPLPQRIKKPRSRRTVMRQRRDKTTANMRRTHQPIRQESPLGKQSIPTTVNEIPLWWSVSPLRPSTTTTIRSVLIHSHRRQERICAARIWSLAMNSWICRTPPLSGRLHHT